MLKLIVYCLLRKTYKIILHQYYRDDKPSSIYWADGQVRGRLVVRGWVKVVIEVDINE